MFIIIVSLLLFRVTSLSVSRKDFFLVSYMHDGKFSPVCFFSGMKMCLDCLLMWMETWQSQCDFMNCLWIVSLHKLSFCTICTQWSHFKTSFVIIERMNPKNCNHGKSFNTSDAHVLWILFLLEVFGFLFVWKSGGISLILEWKDRENKKNLNYF